MTNPEDHEDLKPTNTPGYKVGAAKTAEEYANLDAEDESLARWKASLGILSDAPRPAAGPKLTFLNLELFSTTLPPGKKLILDPTKAQEFKNKPITIKEGVLYNVQISFNVNHSIISGIRYLQVVKRAGVKVDKMEEMLGSYGPNPDPNVPYVKRFEPEESPAGIIVRTGVYSVRSRVIDDDGEIYADFDWSFKIDKEW